VRVGRVVLHVLKYFRRKGYAWAHVCESSAYVSQEMAQARVCCSEYSVTGFDFEFTACCCLAHCLLVSE
jgi:hypothetical protein